MMTTISPPAKTTAGEDIWQSAEAIYERDIKHQVEPNHIGKIVIIDVVTEAWEIVPDMNQLAIRGHALGPSTTRFARRIGPSPALIRRGGPSLFRPNG